MHPITDVNLASPAFKANPHPFYRRLREEAPVCQVKLSRKHSIWLIARYDDVVELLKDERFAKDRRRALTKDEIKQQPWIPGVFKPLMSNMLDTDPPDHTRLRALVHKAFTPRRVEQLGERVEQLTDELLQAMQAQGRVDLIQSYALPIPTTIIAELLGVPVADRHAFHRWSSAIVSAGMTNWEILQAVPSTMAFLRYLRKLVRARRADPQDDLISALVQAEENGSQLNEDELLAMIFVLLVAGHETTVNLIGSGALALLEHPGELDRLRSEPALIKTAVEELLRFTSPVELATERYATENIEVAGVTIPRAAIVYGVLASANRDERQFANPDALDLARQPNKHLALGQGIHYCLGAPLARLEGQIAITALLRRSATLRLDRPPEALRWRRGMVLRGLRELPVSLSARAA